MRLLKTALVVGALLTVAPVPAAADVLIMRSTGPSAAQLRPGLRLRDGATIRLANGDRVLVLEGRGTRLLQGPTAYIAGATRVPAHDLTSIWRQRGPRRATGGSRGPEEAAADRISGLVDQAIVEAAAGRYPRANRLLAQAESEGFSQRVQCRVVWNLRLQTYLAQARPLPASARADPCVRFPVPDSLIATLEALDREREQLLEAFQEWK